MRKISLNYSSGVFFDAPDVQNELKTTAKMKKPQVVGSFQL